MLGLHINKITEITRCQALKYPWPVIKFFNTFDEDLIAEIKQKNPRCIIVGRCYYPDQNINSFDAAAPILSQTPRLLSLVDYWESYNEILTKDNAAAVAEKNLDVVKLLHNYGLKYCALSLSCGMPSGSDDDMRKTLDILWPAVEAADAWSIHLYGAPDVMSNADWYVLRARKIVQLDPRYATRPCIGTEGGIDFGVIDNKGGGWQRHGVSTQAYTQGLLDLQTELLKDAVWFKGLTIFQAGDDADPNAPGDGDATWGSFNIGEDVTDAIGPKLATPPPPKPADPDLAYFGMYGHTPNPEGAVYKFALLPLRKEALAFQAAGKTALFNLTNPGPCVSDEYLYTASGSYISYRVKLTNRIIEVRCIDGVWTPFQVELFK